MKKAGFLALSLAIMLIAGAARADIASTSYVENAIAQKEDVSNKASETYTSDSTTQYPSIRVAETIAAKAVQGVTQGLGDLAGLDQVGTDEIKDGAVTKVKLDTDVQASLGKADTAVQPAALTAETQARTNADNAINTKIGTVPAGKTVVGMIDEAKTAATYDDTQVKADIAANTAAIEQAQADATKGIGDAAAAAQTANAAKAAIDNASTGLGSKLPTATYNTQVGTVSAANMGTTATTVVAAINEVSKEAAAADAKAVAADTKATAAQSAASAANTLAAAAIPKPSGTCKDCVLKYNGTAFSWEEIGR